MNQSVSEFLKKHNADELDVKTVADDFVKQGRTALSGGPSSLEMIPARLHAQGEIPAGEKVIFIDAGGTNLRIGLAFYNKEGELVIEKQENRRMLGKDEQLTAEEFFDRLAELVLPLTAESRHIGFCFSFPFISEKNNDGRILLFDKEIKISGAEGLCLGEELCRRLEKLSPGLSPTAIVLNDTTATMMGGIPKGSKAGCDHFMGLIIGTGFNTCYFQKSSGVLKDPELASGDGYVVIVMESGGYDCPFKSDFEVMIDELSAKPGKQRCEKTVSGEYQGWSVWLMLKAAAEEGLFSENTGKKILAMEKPGAGEVDGFIRMACALDDAGHVSGPCGGEKSLSGSVAGGDSPSDRPGAETECPSDRSGAEADGPTDRLGTEAAGPTDWPGAEAAGKLAFLLEDETDRKTAAEIIDAYYDRAARLAAAVISGTMRLGSEGEEKAPIYCIAADGSVFYKTLRMRPLIDRYLGEYAKKELGFDYRFVKVEEGNFAGITAAVLLNKD